MDIFERILRASELYDDNKPEPSRTGFYKAGLVTEGPNTGKYKVKFPGKSNAAGYPDKFVGTQFGSKEDINELIKDRKEFTKTNIKNKPNIEKIQKEKNFKNIVDNIFENKDFKNFKATVTESQKRFAKARGKTRTDTGGKIPQQYLNEFNKAMEAGPGSDLFKNMMKITGRTEEELLELNLKRPGGKVDPKLRSERALEFGGREKQKTKEELAETKRKSQIKRGENIAAGKKYASTEDLMDVNKIEKGKKEINKYFEKNPELINTTEFGKNIKKMMAIRIDQKGNMYSKVMPDEYYLKKAKEGSLFDIFDITPVSKRTRNVRFPANLNITPGDFNSAFVQGQAVRLFEKGINEKALSDLENFFKERNIRVELPNVGRIGAAPDVAVNRKTGEFPRIVKTLESMKAPPEILDIFRKYAAIGCPGKAKGGRVDFNIGGSAQCITRGLEKVRSGTNLSPGDKANIKSLTNKNPKALTSAARTLSSLGLGTEAALGGFFALTDYATGANKQEIFSNLTYGLAGKDMQEQLKQQDPMYGKADQLDKIFSGYLTGLDRPKGLRPGKITTETDVSKAMQPFTRVNPQTVTGDFFDFNKFQTQMQKDREAEETFAKEKIERALERGFYDPGIGGSQRISEFAAADGGIAGLSGGAKSGPAPESGKTPHGLLSIKNNVKKY